MTITNTGEIATDPLQVIVRPEFSSQLDVTGGTCLGAELEPQQSCDPGIFFVPKKLGPESAEVTVFDSTETITIQVNGVSGDLLTVEKLGAAPAHVISDPAGIRCPYECAHYFPRGTTVELTPDYDAGTHFAGFEGACEGGHCELTLDGGTEVQARFEGWLRMSVTHLDSAQGGIFFGAGRDSQFCADNCEAAISGAVTLTATGEDSVRWGSDCADAGSSRHCQLVLEGPTQVSAHFVPYNRVFPMQITIADIEPDLSGADALCQAGALQHGLSGVYLAWLARPGASAQSRFASASGWVDRWGRVPIAQTAVDLVAGRALSALTTEHLTHPIVTGGDGTLAETCQGWTSSSGSAVAGSPGAAGTTWYRDDASPLIGCGDPAYVLCFGSSYAAGLNIPPLPPDARPVFVSSPWGIGGGQAGADAHCTQEANDAGYPGNYGAVHSPFHVSGLRSDGVSSGLYSFASVGMPINVTVDGQYLSSPAELDAGTRVWTTNSEFSSPEYTCENWASPSGTGAVGRPEFIGLKAGSFGTPVSCELPQRLYCRPQSW